MVELVILKRPFSPLMIVAADVNIYNYHDYMRKRLKSEESVSLYKVHHLVSMQITKSKKNVLSFFIYNCYINIYQQQRPNLVALSKIALFTHVHLKH